MAKALAIGGAPVNLTASGLVANVPGVVIGVIVNSANATGSFQFRNGGLSNSPVVMGPLIPGNGISGTFIPCYFEINSPTGCYCTIAATLNITTIFASYGQSRTTPTSPPQA